MDGLGEGGGRGARAGEGWRRRERERELERGLGGVRRVTATALYHHHPPPSLSSPLSPRSRVHTQRVFFFPSSSSRFLFVLRTLGAAIPHPAPLPPPPISPAPNSPTPPTSPRRRGRSRRDPSSPFILFPEAIHRPAHPSSSPRRAGSRPARPFLSRRARSLRVPSPRRPPRPHRAFSARSRLSPPPIPPPLPAPLSPSLSRRCFPTPTLTFSAPTPPS